MSEFLKAVENNFLTIVALLFILYLFIASVIDKVREKDDE